MKSLIKNESRRNMIAYLLIIVVCAYVLHPLFEIAQYNRPSADDYDYGIRTREVILNGGGLFALLKAAWNVMAASYNNLSGLYTSAIVLSLHPGIWGEENYVLSTYIIVAVFCFFTFWCLYIINKHLIRRSVLFVAAATAVVVTMLVLWLPSAWEALYWYNGAMNYMPYVFMNALNLCLLWEAATSIHSVKGKAALGISSLMAFVVSGGNQVTSFSNILLLLFAAGFMAWKKKFYGFLPLLSALIGFAVMYFSPGTGNRAAIFAGMGVQQTVVGTIIATIKHWIYIIGDWVSLTWLLSLILITPIAMEIAYKNKERFSVHFPLIPILMSGAVISGMFCVPYLPMGFFGQGRVTNVIWASFMLLSWLIYVLIWGWLAANDYVNLQKIFEKKYAGLTGVLVVCVCLFALFRCHDDTMSVSMWAVHELETGIAQSYGQQMDDRIAKYRDPSLTEVAVEPIREPSSLLFWGEIDENPKEWPNGIMGKWYGGKDIYVLPSEIADSE